MILLIDNYDSFTYNLYQLLETLRPGVKVCRNDALSAEQIAALRPEAVVLSPGPGRPEDAGVCIGAIRALAGKIPILGVCLGHQAICQAFGGRITYARCLMHGKASPVTVENGSHSLLFQGISSPFMAARYHSLAAEEAALPPQLKVTARSADGEIMALEHRLYPVFGLQFHPESILTPGGSQILRNFLTLAVPNCPLDAAAPDPTPHSRKRRT